jgi:hypothetical protein
MRDKLSILIMEGTDDKLAVEIYKDGPTWTRTARR